MRSLSRFNLTRVISVSLTVAFCGCHPRLEALDSKIADTQSAIINGSCPQAPALMDTSHVPTKTGGTWPTHSTGDLQNALGHAQPGDEITLDPAVTYAGPFTLPTHPDGSAWIIIRSSATTNALFPAAGARVEKGHESMLAKITAPSSGLAAITTTDGSNHGYWIIGIEVIPAAGGTEYDTLVNFGNSNSATNAAKNIVLDRSWVHGQSANVRKGVLVDGANLAVINSRISEIHEPRPANGVCSGVAKDCQAITGLNGTGPYKVDNNYLAAATEGLIFGGGDPNNSNMIPSDIQISRNHIYKPVTSTWRSSYLVKTAFELKNAQRVLVSGNYVENSWDNCTDENSSVAFRVTPRNQDGGAPWSTINNVKIIGNKFINHAKGISLLGSDDNNPSARMSCLDIENNLFEKMPGDFAGDWTSGLEGQAIALDTGGWDASHPGGIQNLTIQHNTMHSATGYQFSSALMVNWGERRQDKNTGFLFYDNLDIAPQGIISGDGLGEGDVVLNTYFDSVPSTSFARNDFVTASSSHYTTHCSTNQSAFNYCWFDTSASTVGFSDPNYSTDFNYQLASSSHVHNQCTHQFDTPSNPQDIGIYDWSQTTGVGVADVARDVQPDFPPGCQTCGSDCVDKQNDPFNCGGCGTKCSPGQACVSGVCTGGGNSCAPLSNCNGVCVDETSDPHNCGGCGTQCTTSPSCCNSLCVNTTNDFNNCGSCGHACLTGQTCISSACVTQSSGRKVVGTDLDADLKGDFMTRDSAGNFQVWKSNGTVQTLVDSYATSYDDADGWNDSTELFAVDIDGDGKTDLLARGDDGTFDVNLSDGTEEGWANEFSTTLSNNNGWLAENRMFPADVNGDGKSDLLARQTNGTWQVWLSDGAAWNSSGTFTSYYTDTGLWGSGNRFYFLDINGDGKTDFIARGGNGGWDVNISNGSSYTVSSSFSTTYTDANGFNSGNYFFVADVNGDKKGDLLVRNPNGTFDVWLSNGTTLVYSTSFTSYFTDEGSFGTGNRFMARDVNGDGKTDLVMRYANGAFEEWYSDGTVLYGAYAFPSDLTDANGWNDGIRFY